MLGDMHGATGVALLALHQVCRPQRRARFRNHFSHSATCAQAKAALGGPCSTPLAMGTGNTALEFHAGRLLALQEGSLPWHLRVLCDGALETIGSCTFDDAAPRTFTAHPKVDALTSEMCFISYQVDKTPHLAYGVLDADGKPLHVTPVPIRFPQMLHDFAITRSYAVFWDLPLVFEPKEMVAGDKLPFVFEKTRGAAFGVMQRRAEGSECRWFSLPGCMIFHSLACWEEEDAQLVRLFAARIEDFDLTLPPAGKSHDVRTIDGGFPTLFEFVFDLRTGEATQSCVIPLPEGVTGMDFPRAHPHLTGAKVRYGYLALFAGLVITGVAKVDLETRSIVGRIDYPDGMCGGEAYFVPSHEGAPGPGQEDDGWLFTYVSSPSASSLWIMDAKSMNAKPAAVLPLPTRVPWGFHSKWVPQTQLAAQRAS